MSLPNYAYTFSNIDPVNENRAKKRVIESLMRHYTEADPEIYLNNVEEVDINIINTYIDDIISNLNNLISYVYVDSKATVRFLFNFIGDSTVSFKKTIINIQSTLRKMENFILDIKQKISNVSFNDMQKLIKKSKELFSVYNTTYNTFYDKVGIKFVKGIKGLEIVEALFNELNGSMYSLETKLTEIFKNYNERRQNLFTKTEVDTQRKLQGGYYSLSNPDDYKIGEYV